MSNKNKFDDNPEKIASIYLALEEWDSKNPLKRRLARILLKRLCSEKSLCGNSMRLFTELYNRDKIKVDRVIEEITEFLDE